MPTSLTPLRRSTRRCAVLAAVAATAIAGAGCTPERGETDSDDTVASTLAIPEVTAPPERQTPFCQIMLELDASLPDDQTIDVTDVVLDAYREALPVAPPEIADDLNAVIVGLETGTVASVPTTAGDGSTVDGSSNGQSSNGESAEAPPESSPDVESTAPDTFVPPTGTGVTVSTLEPPSAEEAFDAEGYLPDDDPAIRLNEYVDFTCRDNINNPGPPATQPSATPVPLIGDETDDG